MPCKMISQPSNSKKLCGSRTKKDAGFSNSIPLLLPRQYHLFSLTPPLLKLLPGVLAFILLLSLDALELVLLNLRRLLDHGGNVAMASDAANLGHVAVALDQGVVVLESLALAGGFDALALRGVGAPQPDVAVVGA